MTEPLNGSNLRSVFLLLTRAHFSTSKNYGYLEPQLSCVEWNTDPFKSTLAVELSQEYERSKNQNTPAVYVGFDQPFSFKKIDLSDNASDHTDNSGRVMGVLTTAALSLIHVAPTMDMALLLADSSASFFLGTRDSVAQRLNLIAFDPISISPPVMVDKGPERNFRVDVTFGLSFNYVINANIESHRLKKFAMEFAGK